MDGEGEQVAIIAMAGRFPEANCVSALWDHLQNGKELLQDLPDAPPKRRDSSAYCERRGGLYVPRGGFVQDAESFDASFFRYSRREACLTDPQQRLFLEVCHEALEQAGYGAQGFAGSIGVFAGARASTWLPSDSGTTSEADRYMRISGNSADALATRVAYKLGCSGPAISICTFCSGSLVAAHLACQQLRRGECDLALAGGACVRFPQNQGYYYHQGGILSESGRCYAFDRRADGTIFSDAVAAIALRRLEDATRSRDPIIAVIKGSAINNDGSERAGYVAPGVLGQAAVIARALEAASVAPEEVGMVEAHGTGTRIGDSIEWRALNRAFAGATSRHCALGSVKTNLGHSDCAAGIVGLIKAAKAVQTGIVPPTLNFRTPNDEISLADSLFYFPLASEEWRTRKRIAAVSSFGIGGTNAHMIVGEPPQLSEGEPSRDRWHLLPFSAITSKALKVMLRQHLNYLLDNPEVSLADMAYTLQRGRQERASRYALVAGSHQQALNALQAGVNGEAAPVPPGSAEVSDLAQSWVRGSAADWNALYRDEQRRRICLPTYPFERACYSRPSSNV